MKKTTVCMISALTFIIGLNINNFAMSNLTSSRIASVDVNKVVLASKEVRNLKKDQDKKAKELKTWKEKATADIQKQTTEANKKKLTEKYNTEYKKKQEALTSEYKAKLKSIDSNISDKITKEAKAQNYDIVLSKNIVLYGTDDITDLIVKAVK